MRDSTVEPIGFRPVALAIGITIAAGCFDDAIWIIDAFDCLAFGRLWCVHHL